MEKKPDTPKPKTLECCPFCKSDDLSPLYEGEVKSGLYWISCHGCGASGPVTKTPLGAVQKWNRKP